MHPFDSQPVRCVDRDANDSAERAPYVDRMNQTGYITGFQYILSTYHRYRKRDSIYLLGELSGHTSLHLHSRVLPNLAGADSYHFPSLWAAEPGNFV